MQDGYCDILKKSTRNLNIQYLIMHCPSHILQITVVEEGITVEFHPYSNLLYTDCPDFCYWIPVKIKISVKLKAIFNSSVNNRRGVCRALTKISYVKSYRYRWTNTPLKIAFIMFSISSWFSWSWKSRTQIEMVKHTSKLTRGSRK